MMSEKADLVPSKALVVGLGVSGRSVCELLLDRGAHVTATDLRPLHEFNGALDRLKGKGCLLRLGSHTAEDFLKAEQIIVSPGVPLDLDLLVEARYRGIPILGELEWAWRQVIVPVIAVTGTNGKTTTTTLIGEMLKASGRRVFVGGNIGTPLSRWVFDGDRADILVLEVSSFQLDTATTFRPEVGVLLNITEDHLDRYPDFAGYADSKLSVFSRQLPSDVAVLNGDDPLCRSVIPKLRGRALVSSRRDPAAHATGRGNEILVRIPWRKPFALSLENARLKGIHNEENIRAAVLAVSSMGAEPSVIQGVIDDFPGLPHRVEWLRTWRGIDFYNDSKGTNVGAVLKALENFDRPVLILLGGRDKLGSYAALAESLEVKGKGAFVFGEAAPRIAGDLAGHVPVESFKDLDSAFAEAVRWAVRGDVVLLSPACSSFDQYESYVQRGNHFRRLVEGLAEES
jgi:UDP-N-acetylmuramoylalanine--D-glutamate ligase